MSQNEEPKEDLQDASKREALAKLAKMTAYSTPAVVTLLTPQLSHAQASIQPGNPACNQGWFVQHFVAGANPGSDFANPGASNGFLDFFRSRDDGSDCG